MAHSITGLFATRGQVERVDGALRDAGFDAKRITVVGPDSQMVRLSGQAQEHHGIGAWLVEHLVQRGHSQEQAQEYHDKVALEGRWLVSVAVRDGAEDADARNLMVASGAAEISSARDGQMVKVA
jgi:hypothetical protein